MLAPLMLLETRVDLCQQYTAFPLFCFKACLSVTVCVWVPACLFPFISFFLLDPLSLFLSLCLPLLSFSLCLTINVSSACFSRSPACLFSFFFVYFRFVCMYGLCLWLLLILLYFIIIYIIITKMWLRCSLRLWYFGLENIQHGCFVCACSSRSTWPRFPSR